MYRLILTSLLFIALVCAAGTAQAGQVPEEFDAHYAAFGSNKDLTARRALIASGDKWLFELPDFPTDAPSLARRPSAELMREARPLTILDEHSGFLSNDGEAWCYDLDGRDCAAPASTQWPVSYDVPVVINKSVEKFITYFEGPGRAFFTKWLERSTGYLPLLKGILNDEGLPEDLAYLALIESGMSPYATSRAKAVGIWQFMVLTGRYNGLRTDWWIDERRDPELSTMAAARHLKTLYKRFDSWYLAAASYNAGEGRINRAIRKNKTKDFWKIAANRRTLKLETRQYVPKYLAAMIIAKDPERYGFTDLKYHGRIEYDKVVLREPTDIKVIAKAAGATVEEIKKLNPALKRWFTPPNYNGFEIKIPDGRRDRFIKKMAAISPKDRLRFHSIKLKRGDSLYNIARRYKTEVKPIMYLNNIKNARRIRAGATIVVPVRERASKKRLIVARADIPNTGSYTIKKGDTLWDITNRYGISLEKVLEWNGMSEKDVLRPGRTIILKEARLITPAAVKRDRL